MQPGPFAPAMLIPHISEIFTSGSKNTDSHYRYIKLNGFMFLLYGYVYSLCILVTESLVRVKAIRKEMVLGSFRYASLTSEQ